MFGETPEDSKLWWICEAPTKLRDLGRLAKKVSNRIRNSGDTNEVRDLRELLKKLNIIIAMVQVVHDHGSQSQEFCKVYDLEESLLELMEGSDLEFPPCEVGTPCSQHWGDSRFRDLL